MRFEYLEPKSVADAISLLTRYDGRAKVIAGGTALVPLLKRGVIRPEYVINLASIPGLEYINYDEKQGLRIGALTTIRALEKSRELQQRYRIISQAAAQLASVGIRNIATLGGNLCGASSSADMVPALIVLSARVNIAGPTEERVTPLEDFFTGPGGTILSKGELVTEIQVPLPSPRAGGVYLKHGIRPAIDRAVVGVAVFISLAAQGEACQEIRIALGAAAPTVMRAHKAEDIIRGETIDDKLIERSAQAACEEARPKSDVRASAEYKRQMVKVFTSRLIREALALARAA